MKEKRCTGRCRQVKPLTDFNKKTASKDGRKPQCKACTREARPSRAGTPRIVSAPKVIIPPERISRKCMDRWWV